MIFSGLEFQKEVPFTNVFIHATILTKEGKRMSKSLGTGIDPLRYIEERGADATRFAIVWQASGQDVHWDEAAVIAGQKFANKMWNAARFVLEKGVITEIPAAAPKGHTEADRAILVAFAKVRESVGKDIESFEFSRPLHDLYDFFWHAFCDVYLEASKPQLADPKLAPGTRAILAFVLFESLKLLHPFLPFVTEAIYQELPKEGKIFLMVEPW